jgi:dCMP deaminase
MPCIICAKMIINAGIQRVVYDEGYADQLSMEMVAESGLLVEKFLIPAAEVAP